MSDPGNVTAGRPPAACGTVAFVTGAGRGIGAAIAVALARDGVVPVLAVRDPAGCDDVLRAVESCGVEPFVVACDVSDARSVAAAVQRSVDALGRIDIVVNNAGRIDPIGRIADVSPDDWDGSIRTNLFGPFAVVRSTLPQLSKSSAPTIVNLSSGAAHGTREGWSAYCSAKAGLAMLTRCIAVEYPQVAVYGLQPGVVDTDMQVRIRASGINDISRIPRDRLAPVGKPASWVAWLCRERPVDLVGQDLSINDPELARRFAAFDGASAASSGTRVEPSPRRLPS